MKNYFVRIKTYIPAPRERDYRVEASSFRTAIGRSIRDFRKEFKGRKMNEIIVRATKL